MAQRTAKTQSEQVLELTNPETVEQVLELTNPEPGNVVPFPTLRGGKMEVMYPITVNPKFRVDIEKLPALTLKSLCQQAVNHRMSNMVDAEANAWIRVDMLKLKASNPKDMSDTDKRAITKQIVDWRKLHETDYEAKRAELQAEKWQEMLDGFELGSRGARIDPVEKEYNALILKYATNRFAEISEHPFPKDDTPVGYGKQGKTITRTEILTIATARYGNEARARAEAIVAERNAKAAAVAPVDDESF